MHRAIKLPHIIIGLISWVVVIFNPGLSDRTYAQNCAPVTTGLIGWWPGNGNAEDIQGTRDALVMNGVTFSGGLVGQAFNLDGINDYVIIPNTGGAFDVDASESFSWDTWFRTTGSISGGLQTILAKEDGDRPTFTSLMFPDGTIHCSLQPSEGGTFNLTSADSYDDGSFHHLACVLNQSNHTLTMIVDGGVENLQTSVPAGSTFVEPSTNVLIGARIQAAPDRFFAGQIDEVDIFNRALSVAEVHEIFAAGSSGKCLHACFGPPANLIGWWPGDGNVDDIEGTRDAVLINGATFGAGTVAQAFSLDGVNDYVVIPNTGGAFDFDATESFSWDAWFSTTGSISGGLQTILAKEDGDRPSFNSLMVADGKVSCGLQPSEGGTFSVSSAGSYKNGSFHHLACVFDRSNNTLTMVVDGSAETLQTSIPTGSTFIEPSTDVLIGARIPAAPDRFFAGQVDEADIFSRALSVAEIQEIFAAGNKGKCKDTDSDRFYSSEDCNDRDICTYPGAAEACDLLDNDCDGSVDEDPSTVPIVIRGLQISADRTSLQWPICGLTTYDIVKGDLGVLRATRSFTSSLLNCLENDSVDGMTSDAETPGLGGGFYYLARGNFGCGQATYDSENQSQLGARDAEISASPEACP
jgi:hypothetical protein